MNEPAERAARTHRAKRWSKYRCWMAAVIGILIILFFLFPLRQKRSKAANVHRQPPQETKYRLPPYPQVYAPPLMPTVQRAPAGDDVRVEFVTVGTSVNNMMCAHWTSSVLSGRPTTVAGYGKKHYTHQDKLHLLNQAIELKKMRDWDVVVYLDQDTVFTGEDFQPFIDDFVHRSPAHPADIDVREIRRGAMAAPLRLSTDPVCWAPASLKEIPECAEYFKTFDEAINQYATTHDFRYLWQANTSVLNASTNELYINSGFYMARVWAFRELLVGQSRFLPEFPYPGMQQNCDQSVFVALYMDLRWTELTLNLLEPNATRPQRPAFNQFGLHYGLIDIWRVSPPATLAHLHGVPAHRIDAFLYDLPYHTSMPEVWIPKEQIGRTIRGILHEVVSPQRFIRDVPHPPPPYGASQQYHRTPLRVARSLLGMSPRLIDRSADGSFPSLFSPLIHFADHPKDPRVEMYLPFLGWFIAMDLESGQRQRALELLRTTEVGVVNSTTGNLSTLKLSDHCSAWINQFVANGVTVY